MLHGLIIQLQETPSRTSKEGILEKFLPELDDHDLKYLHNIYTPFLQTNLKKYKMGKAGRVTPPTSSVNALFAALNTREISGKSALLEVAALSEGTTIKFHRLIQYMLDKNIRAGVGIGTLNRALKKLKMKQVSVFDCMLASPYNEKHLLFPCYVEPKLDGVRCLTHVESGYSETTVTMHSRSGKVFENFGVIASAIKKAFDGVDADVYLDGEVVDGDFDNLMTSVGRKADVAFGGSYIVFDLITAADMEAGGTDWPIEERRAELLPLLGGLSGVTVISQQKAHTIESVASITADYVKRGYEGSVCKPVGCGYATKRSRDWIKVKPFFDMDLEIVGFEEGAGRNKGKLGATLVRGDDVACKVGSGWSDDLRTTIWDNQEAFLGRVIEVQYQERTKDGSLRFPTVKGFRDVEDAVGDKI